MSTQFTPETRLADITAEQFEEIQTRAMCKAAVFSAIFTGDNAYHANPKDWGRLYKEAAELIGLETKVETWESFAKRNFIDLKKDCVVIEGLDFVD